MGHLRVVGHALQPISSLDSRAVDPRPAQGTVVSWRCRNYCGSSALWCFSAQVFSVCYIKSFGDCIARDTKMLPGNVQRYQVWETRNLSQVRWNPRNLCRLNLTCLVSVSNLLKNSRGEACWSELMTCTLWCEISNLPWRTDTLRNKMYRLCQVQKYSIHCDERGAGGIPLLMRIAFLVN